MNQCGSGRLAVGAGNADNPVSRQIIPGQGKQFDVADDRHSDFARSFGNRVTVERHTGRDDNRVKSGQVDLHRILESQRFAMAGGKGCARLLAAVPGRHMRPARHQAFDNGCSRTGKAEDGIAFVGKGG